LCEYDKSSIEIEEGIKILYDTQSKEINSEVAVKNPYKRERDGGCVYDTYRKFPKPSETRANWSETKKVKVASCLPKLTIKPEIIEKCISVPFIRIPNIRQSFKIPKDFLTNYDGGHK
jgi:hypothetical protein